jgi:glycosyltransferase involved in cell wall biosynthesis
VQLSASLARLHAQGEHRLGAVFIGDGPERTSAEYAARDVPGVTFTGAVPHADLPQCLAAADIGVAPFDPGKHKPLILGFYWSPLKIFEYMSSGLPVVAPRLPRIAHLVGDDEQGVLYDPIDPRTLDAALVRLTDAALRARLGASARQRAVAHYSWSAHCEQIDARLQALIRR